MGAAVVKTSFFGISFLGFRTLNYHNIFTGTTLPLHKPCSSISTNVESSLQINKNMQNKPKLRKTQMNVNNVLTSNYKNRTLRCSGKNKPTQTQFKPNSKGQFPKKKPCRLKLFERTLLQGYNTRKKFQERTILQCQHIQES